MDVRLARYENFHRGTRRLIRFKHFLALYGVGIYFWIDYLWGILLDYLKYTDEKFDNWLIGLIFERPPKVYPIVYALDLLSMAVFIAYMSYVIYWIYTDTYIKLAKGEEVRPFKRQMFVAIGLNGLVYLALRIPTDAYRIYG